MSWQEVLARTCKEIKECGRLDEAVRTELDEACSTMNVEDAYTLYEDLLKLKIALDAHDLSNVCFKIIGDLIDTSDEDLSGQFCRIIIDNGRFIDRLADCIDLSYLQRLHKWQTEEDGNKQMMERHRVDSNYIAAWSKYLYDSRNLNADAFEKVRAELQNGIVGKRREWHDLILLSSAELEQKDLSFWYAIQTRRLKIEEKRAVVFRIKQMKHCAGKTLHTREFELSIELFYDLHQEYKPTRKRFRRFRGVLKRIYRLINFSMF